MTVLVAGAGGFIGANLVRALSDRGVSVQALVRPGSSLARLEDAADRITVHQVDATDRASLRDCLEAARPDAVVNAMRAPHGTPDPLDSTHGNVTLAANLLVSAAGAGCRRFVQLGSSTEYEPRRGPLAESTPLRPASLHGATKAAATLVLRALAAELRVRLTVLRPFQVYGPRDAPRHLVPTAIAAALDDRELVLAPSGRRDWVYVADVVEACVLALDVGLDCEELNIGSGRHWSNAEIVDTIAELSGRRMRVRIDERAGRSWDRDDWVADVTRARTLLGWLPRHDLVDGLRETIAWERTARGRDEASSADAATAA